MTDATPPVPRDRASALMIGGGSLLMALAMAHHPTAHGETLNEVVHGMVRGAAFNGLIHGVLVAVIGLLAIGYAGFADGLAHPRLARAGRLAYFAGALALGAAGLVNGFATPALAAALARGDAAALAAARPVFDALWALNQAFAAAGVVAIGTAVVVWSIALFHQAGFGRWVGAAGALASSACLVALIGGWLTLDVHGFGLFVLIQAVWGLAVAALMLWGRR
jgi:hypothetical protein